MVQAVSSKSERSFQSDQIDPISLDRTSFSLDFNSSILNRILNVPEREDRGRHAQQQLYEQIALIARVFSKEYGLKVMPSPIGGWSCTIDPKGNEAADKFLNGEIQSLTNIPAEYFKPKIIYYDKEDLKHRTRDENLGLIRHEVGHANHSDFRLLLQGQKIAKDEGYLPTSWLSIMNALEDPWVNNKEIAGSDVVREKMIALYSSAVPDIEAHINEQPLTRQIGLNIIHYWATGEGVKTLKDPRVLKLFEELKQDADQYFNNQSAIENFELLRDRIWPKYKVIETQAIENETLKDAAKQLSGELAKESGSEIQEGGGSFGKKILQRIKKMLGIKENKEKADQEIGKNLSDSLSNDEREEIKGAVKRQSKEINREDNKKEKNGLPRDLDLTKFSDEAMAALKKAIDSLTPEQKQALKEKARKILDKKQTEALKDELPKFLEMKRDSDDSDFQAKLDKSPSNEDQQQADNQLEQILGLTEDSTAQAQMPQSGLEPDINRAAELMKELQQLEMRKDGFDHREQAEFELYRQLESEMLPKIKEFIRMIEPHLPKENHMSWDESEHYIGKRLNLRKAHERIPIGDYRIYERRELRPHDEPKLFVQLIIDASGSMAGEKMRESLKTAIFWGTACSILKIPLAIKFFGDYTNTIMKFGDDFEKPGGKIKPQLVQFANANGGSTDMGTPLNESHQELNIARRRYPGSLGAVFVISDSGANSGLTGQPLRDLIKSMQKSYVVQNIILTNDSREVDQARGYFGVDQVVAPPSAAKLPDHAYIALRRAVEKALRKH